MTAGPLELVQFGLLVVGVLLWIAALARGRALEWFSNSTRLPPWTISGSNIAAVGGGFCLVVLFVPALSAWIFGFDLDVKPLPARTAMIQSYALQLGWLAVAMAVFGVKPLRPPPGGTSQGAAIVAGFTGLVLFFPAGQAVGRIWNLLLPLLQLPKDLQTSVDYLKNVGGPGELMGWVGVIVVLAPLTEELLFRGMVYRYAAAHLPEPAALGISAVFFGLLHWNAASFLPLVALGLALNMAYRYTGRLITPIVMHAAFNLNTLVYLVLGGAI
jgi:CAAX protease family protein